MRRTRGNQATAKAIQPIVRCAVYTRKSTEKGLDRDFTSIDNQRQVCERFVSQMENAILLLTRYDDGGFSGGTTDRPALQQLLSDIREGVVDCVIAYKYDRLGRSMIDCLRIFELFDRHEVRFISVTQQIDTSTSHGRMFVNNLLSHAQFERDLISERTRDKMRAARRKGKWTGGMLPPGYDVAPEGGKLTINKDEAVTVRQIFQLYADHPSLVEVSQELNRRGLRRKSWTTKDGKLREGRPWHRKTLSNFLRNPIYIGKIRLGDKVFNGEHRGIVPKALFEKVQRLLDRNHRDRGASARNKHGALLRSLLRCSSCDAAMTFSPVKKGGRVYRYYRCSAAGRNGHGTCPTKSVSADQVETFVVDEIRHIGANPALQDETFRQAVAQVKAQRRGLKLEGKRGRADITKAKAEIERLTATLSRTDGPAADAVADQLGEVQKDVTRLEARAKEIRGELATLDAQAVNRDELARALEAFDPIWDVLLTPEKERVLRLLIEKIDYDGTTQDLAITWRLSGFGELAEETGT